MVVRHTVRPGDSLSRIGALYGVPWRVIYEENRPVIGPNPSLIRVGMVLVIPGRTQDPAPPPSTYSAPPFVWVEGREDDTRHAWGRSERIRFLILHDPVAASVPGLLRYLQSNDRRVSYHDVIVPGNPPQVHVLVSDATQAVGHAGYGVARDALTGREHGNRRGVFPNLNESSWGICIYKHRDDGGPFPEPLYTAAVYVTAHRARQFGIDPANILSHAEVDPGRRSDPRGVHMGRFRGDVVNVLNERA